MNIADQKAATSLLLDAHHRAGHIEPVDDENGQPAYRVTAARRGMRCSCRRRARR